MDSWLRAATYREEPNNDHSWSQREGSICEGGAGRSEGREYAAGTSPKVFRLDRPGETAKRSSLHVNLDAMR